VQPRSHRGRPEGQLAVPGGPAASRWIPALFGTLVFAYGSLVFLRGAAAELADRRPGMMTLIALAISVSR
jgi:cation transport ATPase